MTHATKPVRLRTDTDIAREAGAALQHAVNVPDTIIASVQERVITLTGEAPWHYQSIMAAWAVHTIQGAVGVQDRVRVHHSVVSATVKASIQAALVRSAQLTGDRITVSADSAGQVTLEGVVRSPDERHQAEVVARSAPGITAVNNDLTIQ